MLFPFSSHHINNITVKIHPFYCPMLLIAQTSEINKCKVVGPVMNVV